MDTRDRHEARFVLLGPVRAWLGETSLRLGPPQQVAVLTALLLRESRPITVGELIDAVWGQTPPAGVVSVVRSYVSRLRKILEPQRPAGQPSKRVVSVADGYALPLEDGALDLRMFEDRAAEAQQFFAAGELDRAAQLLYTALDAWQGQPLAGVPGPVAQAARTQLTERRLSMLEMRFDAELQLGRHREILPELIALSGEHPLRERLCEFRMLALYRSGRQADAFSFFEVTRRTLKRELGVEPGLGLREMQSRLLAADPTLVGAFATVGGVIGGTGKHSLKSAAQATSSKQAGSPQARQSTQGSTPRVREVSREAPTPSSAVHLDQLPIGLPGFTGRQTELDYIDSLLPSDDRASTVVISGMAGVGKTTLAVHWARRVAHRFPDGRLYVNLHGFDPTTAATEPSAAVRTLLDALGYPSEKVPSGLAAQTAVFRNLLAGRRMLILLDNARDPEQVRPLLPAVPGCLTLITSRNQMAGLIVSDAAHTLTLGMLSPAEARELLAQRLGRARMQAEPEAVDDLIRRCARLPLALAIVAARAAIRPTFHLSAIAAQIRDSQGSLDAFADADPGSDVRAVFSWSYHVLSSPTAQMFRLLALSPAPDVTPATAASLIGLPVRRTRMLLDELAAAHLLTEHALNRFSCHDLLSSYAGELTREEETAEERNAAFGRLMDHYLHTTHNATRVLYPVQREPVDLPDPQPGVVPVRFTDELAASRWLEVERNALLAGVESAAEQSCTAHVWRLAAALAMFLDRRGHWSDQVVIQRIALKAATKAENRAGQAYAHRALGFGIGRLGQIKNGRRHLTRAVELFQQLDIPLSEARAHRLMSFLANRNGEHTEALNHYRKAAALYESVGDISGEAYVRNEVGWTYILRGQHDDAITQCLRAVALHRETGDRSGEAGALDSLGWAHHHLRQYPQALDCFDQALTLYQPMSDRYLGAETLTHIGDTHLAAGSQEKAARSWRMALNILEELDHLDVPQLRAKLMKLDDKADDVEVIPQEKLL
ncbi:AfsR/SARP family transcriptional regulator [Streptomyces sp. NPDC088847]|uniref:AfsR/SARP family transcriptional regulator n=1 Tax=Streptomyces sp. NPDC088847 TaxID=3365909 RepID=UPI00382FC3CC